MQCIICHKEKEKSDEHIIPEALGNKKLITRRVCEECNNKLGARVDDYLTNHPLVKIIRSGEKLTGKSGKKVNFFSSVETDEKTGIKYEMKSGIPKLMPRLLTNENGHIRIEASTKEEGVAFLKKLLKREGYSETQIDDFCKDAIAGEFNIIEPPEFKKDVIIDFSRMDIAAIKIAYEYAFEVLGEDYLNDEVAQLFSKELYSIANTEKKEINVSDSLAQYVTYPLSGSGIESLLEETRNSIKKTNTDILHTIFFIKQDGCLYCILNLCMMEIISFAVKVTNNADRYSKKLPFTLVYRDGKCITL